MCARSRIETKLRPVEEQVGKKWDTRAGRFLRVLKPTGELVCEKLGRFPSRVMCPHSRKTGGRLLEGEWAEGRGRLGGQRGGWSVPRRLL